MGPITLDEKCAGARSAGNPHAACEVEGAGNGATDYPRRAQRGKPRTQPRVLLRATAPVLDPTGLGYRTVTRAARRCNTVRWSSAQFLVGTSIEQPGH